MKFAASTTLKRAGAALAIGATLLSATGCGVINTFEGDQPTTLMYDASDGVSFTMWPKGNRFDVRNLMLISEGNGQPGRLLGTVLNLSDSDATFEIDWGLDGIENTVINVPANSQIRFEDDANKVIVPSVEKMPGETVTTTQGVIGQVTEAFNLPILDDSLEEYGEYLPNASDTTTAPSAFKKLSTNPGSAELDNPASATPAATATATAEQ